MGEPPDNWSNTITIYTMVALLVLTLSLLLGYLLFREHRKAALRQQQRRQSDKIIWSYKE